MEDQELRKLLEELHSEIEHTDTVDEKSQELLRDLNLDIRGLIERSEMDQTLLHPSVIRRLEETIASVEVTHPDLTILLTKLLAILSNAGI